MKLFPFAHRDYQGREKVSIILDTLHRERGPFTEIIADGRFAFGTTIRLWAQRRRLPVFELSHRDMRFRSTDTLTRRRIDAILKYAKPDVVAIFMRDRGGGGLTHTADGHLLDRCRDPDWFTGELIKLED